MKEISFMLAVLAGAVTFTSALVLGLSALYRRSSHPRVRAQGEAGPTVAAVFFVVSLLLWGAWAAIRFS